MALPKPVSQSAMTGSEVESTIARAASNVSDIVMILASGTPRTAERPNPLAQMASKLASSSIRAESESCAPAATTCFPSARCRLSLCAPVSIPGVALLHHRQAIKAARSFNLRILTSILLRCR